MKTIENLVFKGGGVKGIAYIGALQALKNNNMLADIRRVAGTSAGAITATLVSLKYTPEELYPLLMKKSFADFADFDSFVSGFRHLGMCKGSSFLTWMQGLIQEKISIPDATFADFKSKNCLDLHVYAVDINSNQLIEFSVDKTPNTKVAEAVRASMSIPLFFEAWTFSAIANDLHVDGGLAYNYPINTFDNQQGNDKTLGCYLYNTGIVKEPLTDQIVNNFIENMKEKIENHTNQGFFRNIIDKVENKCEIAVDDAMRGMWHLILKSDSKQTLMKEYLKLIESLIAPPIGFALERDYYNYNRSVIIDDLGCSAINFWISDEEKEKLYQSGITCTTDYLKSH